MGLAVLSLIFISSLVDYFIGIGLAKHENENNRKLLLSLSFVVNIGFLGFFKYYNFFLENFVNSFIFFGGNINAQGLNIILPVGISFYTFQTLSYSIDVYRRKFEPTKDFIAFFTFVSFFPQLVAGPIERAKKLLPQFYERRTFEYGKGVDGLRQILWGLFKKVAIADNCAEYANLIFNNSDDFSGGILILGAVFFTFQIYGDFSGYSDIAIGTARLFGFNLMQNFAFPYFSRDIAEFWRRWHISLSTWFRDYLYIPLGGSRGGVWTKIRNTFIIFTVSGFWHGANWTFIVWGILNAAYFLPFMLLGTNRKNLDVVAQGKYLPTLKEFMNILLTFSLTVFAWIFFRAENLSHAYSYIYNMFLGLFHKASYIQTLNHVYWEVGFDFILLLIFFILIEWLGREGQYAIADLEKKLKRSLVYIMYYSIIIMIFIFWGKRATIYLFSILGYEKIYYQNNCFCFSNLSYCFTSI